jgi:hypothetical protein
VAGSRIDAAVETMVVDQDILCLGGYFGEREPLAASDPA